MSKRHDWHGFQFEDDRFLILQTVSKYEKNEKGKWGKDPIKVEKSVLKDPMEYEHYITAIPLFEGFGKVTVISGYTEAGYVPVKVHTTSPNGMEKLVAEFEFIYKPHLLKDAGNREKEAIANAETFEYECDWERKILRLIYTKDNEAHFAQFDLRAKRWVG